MSFSEKHASESDAPSDLVFVLVATVLCFGILIFRVQNLDYQYDELISLSYSQESWSSLFGIHWSSDTHRPYFYASQKLWNGVFGTEPLAVRSLNVLLGALCVPLIYWIAARLGGRDVARLATICFVLTPLFIYQSREVRMYPLLNLSVLAGTVAFLSLVDRYRTGAVADRIAPLIARWSLFVLAAASAFYAQATGILYIALCGVFVLAAMGLGLVRAAMLRDLILAGVAFVILSLPAILPMIFHVQSTLVDFWIPKSTPSWVYSQLAGAYPYPNWGKPIMAGLLLYGFWAARRNPVALVLLIAFVVGMPLLVTLISLWKPILIVRVIAWPPLFAAILVGFALAAMGQRLWLPALVVVLGIQAYALRPYFPASRIPSETEGLQAALADFDPGRDVLILGTQHLEYGLRWMRPDLVTPDVLALNYSDRPEIFASLNRSRFVTRSEAASQVPANRQIWILYESRPKFPIAADDSVDRALAEIMAKGRKLDQVDSGSLRLVRFAPLPPA